MGQVCGFYAAAGTRMHIDATTRSLSCGLQAKGVMRHDTADCGDPGALPILLACF